MRSIRVIGLFVLVGCSDGQTSGSGDGVAGDPGPGVTWAYEVDLVRDAFGVPHLYAPDLPSAFYGLGWATAEDRLWQMDFNRRFTQGRLLEWFWREPTVVATCPSNPCQADFNANPECRAPCDVRQYNADVLKHDRQLRLIGVAAHNEVIVDALPADVRAYLEAYAAGVNDYVASDGFTLPHGYGVIGVTDFEPWRAVDGLHAWDRIGHAFGPMNHGAEIAALVDCEGLDPIDPVGCAPAACDPPAPIDEEAAVVPESDAASWPPVYSGLPLGPSAHPKEVTIKASHGWVVHGDRSTTGKPILAADPKIGVWAPSLWYPFHLSSGDLDVFGVGWPGAPAHLIYWNRHLGQTVTAAGGDIGDLFEVVDGAAGFYTVDGVDQPYAIRHETIRRADGSVEEELDVEETLFGPVVNELLNLEHVPAARKFALQRLESTRTDTHSLVAALDAMVATDLDTYRIALDNWVAPAVHALYGGVDADDPTGPGHIAYHPLGGIPRRVEKIVDGLDLRGRYPYDGSSLDEQWDGMLTINERPHVIDPEQGYLFSGNHLAVGTWYDEFAYSGMAGNGDSYRSLVLRYIFRDTFATPDVKMTPDQVHAIHFDSSQVLGHILRDMLQYAKDRGQLGADLALTDAPASGSDAEKAQKTLQALDAWAVGGGSYQRSDDHAVIVYALLSAPNINIGLKSRSADGVACVWNAAQGGVSFLAKAFDAFDANYPGPAGTMTVEVISFLIAVAADAWEYAIGEGYPIDPSTWQAPDPFQTYPVVYQRNFFCHHPGADKKDNLACSLDPALAFDVSIDRSFTDTINSANASSLPATIDFADVEGARSYFPPGVSEDPTSPYFDSFVSVWEAVARGETDAMPATPLARDTVDATASSVTALRVPE